MELDMENLDKKNSLQSDAEIRQESSSKKTEISSYLTSDMKNKIVDILKKKEALNACPRCNQKKFTLVSGYFSNTVQKNWQELVLGGAVVPSISIVCDNCGFISQHALGPLGLMYVKESDSDG